MKDNGTKSKIIAAAEELFKQKDYEDIAIREICQLAGISIGAFYRYMGSKEKLFKVFHVKMGTEMARLVLEQTDNKAPVDKIIIIINIYLDFILRYGYKFVKYFLLLSLKNELFAAPPGAIDTFLKVYITEAFDKGEFDSKYTVDYVYRALYSSLRGATFDWCLNSGQNDLRSAYSSTLNILLDEFMNSKNKTPAKNLVQ